MDTAIIVPVAKATIIAAGMGLTYCLPMILAILHHHPRRDRIAVLNILLGWTILGWLVALGWAMLRR